jgi:predicted DNA-binding transcriptional regulator AlpA
MGRTRSMPETRDPLLTVKDLFEILGVSRDTFDKRRYSGRAPLAYKLPNGSLRFRTSVVEEWLEGQADRESQEARRQAWMRGLNDTSARRSRDNSSRPRPGSELPL